MAQVDLIATIPVGDQRDEVLALLQDYAQYEYVCVGRHAAFRGVRR